MRKLFSMNLAIAGLLWNVGMSAPPILKTGTCPTLTRYNAPSADNWGQFPIKPSPAATFPSGTIQNPLTPSQSVNCIQVPVGLRAEIVASELTPGTGGPGMTAIMYFTFDERGRVWAAEPKDYPYPIATDRIHGGKGRILILTDVDGDGSLDNYKVFYDGLVMPTSLEVVNGGVIATVEPNIVFIPNSVSNPDTAGTPIVLYSGMGSTGNTWDTHGGLSSLTSGIDNWYYGHLGYNGGCSAVASTGGAGVTCATGGIWRFKHTGIGSNVTAFQQYSTGPSNAHGIGQMEDGQFFQSGATGSSHSSHAIRQGQASISIIGGNGSPQNAYYPITGDRYIWDFSTAGGVGTTSVSTATSGHDFYTSRLLPKQYWGTRSFVCEGASKLCNQDSDVVNGSTWRAVRLTGANAAASSITSNIFASTDAWVAPIKVRTGPEGGLWVLDWSNYLFLHNPATPATNAAWNNALRTKTSTRLYRILPEAGTREPVLDLSNATTAQLVNTLSNDNFLWRMQAQRLLIGRGYSTELGDSLQNILMNNKGVDTVVGINGSVIHALWTLEGLGRFTADSARWNPILKNLLIHPAWGVRENVLKAMPRTAATAQAINDMCAADDPHPHVRLQAYVALSESPAAPSGAVQGHYNATDSYATTAFNLAGAAKLVAATPANTRPSTCVVIPAPTVVGISQANKNHQPRHDLHFMLNRNGFELMPYGQLASGELVVYDLRGTPVFHSVYNSGKGEWSQITAKGLNMSVYFYSFHGVNGDKFDGRMFLGQDH